MTAISIRRRRTGPVLGLVLALALITGCTGRQKTPESYTDGVRTEFISGCQSTMAADVKAGATISVTPKTFCTCAFEALSNKKTGIEFSEFKKLNEQLVETPGPLPPAFTKAFASCQKPA